MPLKTLYVEREIKKLVRGVWTCVSLATLLLTVLGAELMIYWNRIEGVYRVDSTGQLIPLVLGAALLWTTLLELWRGDVVADSPRKRGGRGARSRGPRPDDDGAGSRRTAAARQELTRRAADAKNADAANELAQAGQPAIFWDGVVDDDDAAPVRPTLALKRPRGGPSWSEGESSAPGGVPLVVNGPTVLERQKVAGNGRTDLE